MAEAGGHLGVHPDSEGAIGNAQWSQFIEYARRVHIAARVAESGSSVLGRCRDLLHTAIPSRDHGIPPRPVICVLTLIPSSM